MGHLGEQGLGTAGRVLDARALRLGGFPGGRGDRLTQYRDVGEVDVGAGQHQDPVFASGGHRGQQGQLGLSGGVAVGGGGLGLGGSAAKGWRATESGAGLIW